VEAVAFNPEVNMSHDQRGQIAHTIASPGFVHINQIMRAEVDKFVIDLINVPEDNDAMVVAKHKLSKAAAQFYQLVINRLNSEANQFIRDASESSAPIVDPTEGLIDLGEHAQAGDDPLDLLGEFDLDPQLLEEELSSE
jgi:hypothetical protein